MAQKRSTVLAAAVAAMLVLGACSDESGDDSGLNDGPDASAAAEDFAWVVAPEESLRDAVVRIEDAVSSSDCGEVVGISWGVEDALPPDAVEGQCDVLRNRLGSGKVSFVSDLGEAGGVLQFETDGPGRATRVVTAVAEDGLYRPVFFDYVPTTAEMSAEGRPGPFLESAEAALDAMAAGDCDALAAVAHHTRTRDWVCEVAEASLAQSLERNERGLRALGATEDYALLAVRGSNVYWLLVMAQQEPAKSAARGYGKGEAPTYALANVVRLTAAE